eukprot:m.221636 g.221636  ORF g.221636 m.221636 type:complete len:183 (-) comp15853_c0_seq1:297-845(-)
MAARRINKKKRAQRATSNIFAMFDQTQIAEFKEVFNLIDHNRDDFIDKEDLRTILNQLGQDSVSDEFIEEMIAEAPGSINFTMFLTMFGEKLTGSDPEDVIKNAFMCFDPDSTGKIDEEQLRDVLLNMGERFTEEEVADFFKYAPFDAAGQFDYGEFVRLLKHGSKDLANEPVSAGTTGADA